MSRIGLAAHSMKQKEASAQSNSLSSRISHSYPGEEEGGSRCGEGW